MMIYEFLGVEVRIELILSKGFKLKNPVVMG